MRFWVKNKIMTLGGSSFVTDEQGNKLLKIKGKIFSPTHKKIVCDPSGNKLFVVRNLRIYGNVTNLATITGYSGLTPDVNVTGLQAGIEKRGSYPTTRTFTFGVNFGF